MGIGDWFSSFCSSLRLTAEMRSSIAYRTARITRQLNTDFRSIDSDTSNRFYVGSFGRNSVIPSVSDIDLLYVLPASMYYQYDAHNGNGQSTLLSAVRASLQKTYASSTVAGDGQVVVINFTDGIRYEVLPAIPNQSDGYTFADSNSGGSWKTCKPKQEMEAFAQRDVATKGNLVELGRMARAWRDCNNVPMSGMLIDSVSSVRHAPRAPRAPPRGKRFRTGDAL
jgi:hypothetical protein